MSLKYCFLILFAIKSYCELPLTSANYRPLSSMKRNQLYSTSLKHFLKESVKWQETNLQLK